MKTEVLSGFQRVGSAVNIWVFTYTIVSSATLTEGLLRTPSRHSLGLV